MSTQYRVVIAGLGGIGTFLSEVVAKILAYRAPGSMLVLVDGDSFEPKNQERQSFQAYGNKAQAKAAELTPQYTPIMIPGLGKWIVDELPPEIANSEEDLPYIAASTLLTEGCIVFAVVDNVATRKVLFDAASLFNDIDIISCGNDEQMLVSLYHYRRRGGKDVTDHPILYHPEYENPPDRNPALLSCQERAELGGTQLVCANVGAAALAASQFHKTIIEGYDPDTSEIHLDLGLGKAASIDRRAEAVLVSE